MLTWFRNMRTATKLILAFTLGGGVGMAIGFLNLYQVKEQGVFVRTMYEDRLAPAIGLSIINEGVIKIRISALEMVSGLYPDQLPVLFERANSDQQVIESLIQKYSTTNRDPEEAKIFEEFKSAWKEFNASRKNTMQLALAGEMGRARESVKGDNEEKYRILDEKIKALIDHQSKEGFELFNKSRKTLATATTVTLAVIVVAILLGIGGGLFIASIIATPLKEMAGCAQKIAAGDLAVKVKVKSQDEVGMLANAFRGMITGLRGMIMEIKSGSDQISSSATQIASTSERAAKNNEVAAFLVEETEAAMQGISTNILNVAQNTQKEVASVTTTSSSIEEMATAIYRIALNAQTLVELSMQAKKVVGRGLEMVEKSVKGTDEINRAISNSARTIAALGSKAEEIDKIVEVIDDIAEQTNLLALNAAIEAARAGEQGLGFAVVAEEVRRLAERSAKSTREIGELVGGVQKEVKAAVSLMEKTTETVEKGVEFSHQLGGSLKDIEESVVEVDRYAKEIKAATEEQSSGTAQIEKAAENLREMTQEIMSAADEQASAAKQIVKSIENLRDTIKQNTSGTVELASSAEELRTQAEKFQQLVGRFVLEGV